MRKMKRENIIILLNIRSVENVGAMFRTADAAGVDKIYLVGYTPTPLDRFGRKRGDMAKSALGAEEFVPWEQVKSTSPLLSKIKKQGFQIIAIEQDKNSINYKKIKPKAKNAFIVGNEVAGISKNVLQNSDLIVEIPMRGRKESLNVATSLGIVLYGIIV